MWQSDNLLRLCAAGALALTALLPQDTFAAATQKSSLAAKAAPKIEPESLQALEKMGAYLRTLTSFELKSDTTTDAVLDNGQKVKFAGTVDYKVRRPNGFLIATSDDRRVRQFYYDGKKFTIYSPRMGFYATVPAPPTIRELLKVVYEKYDVQLPLEDLFRWGLQNDRREDLDSGVVVGPAKIDGQDTDQYAFREGDIDWQIWIARGNKPLPLRAVLTTTSDAAMPEYTASLHWNTNATFSDDTFSFKPPAKAKPITIASE
jgi:hypothetical protein